MRDRTHGTREYSWRPSPRLLGLRHRVGTFVEEGARIRHCQSNYLEAISTVLRSDIGRISVQCASIQSRHSFRPPAGPTAVHPCGGARKVGHTEYWPS